MIKNYIITGMLSISLSESILSQTPEERKNSIEQMKAKEPSKEALERKERSIKKLRKENVPVLKHLPIIADSTDFKSREVEEVAHRAIAIILAAVKGEGLEQATVDSLVEKYGAQKFFSPEELKFIEDKNPTKADRIKFAWRYECGWVLLWSLGYVESLDKPESICDVTKLVTFLIERDTAQFIKDAKLRPINNILDEADLIYRYHWATTSARIKKLKAPAKLDGGVVMERHYALNWLIKYMDQDWDNISTDT